MKTELLNELRNIYNEKQIEKIIDEKQLSVLLKRKEIFENSTIVQDYINLLNQINEYKKSINSEDDIWMSLIDYLDSNVGDDTNKIYVYAGSFIRGLRSIMRVAESSPTAQFDRYIDIESLCLIDVPVEDRKIFRKNNNIIYSDSDVYEIRDKFLTDAINEGQEYAVKRVLTKK